MKRSIFEKALGVMLALIVFLGSVPLSLSALSVGWDGTVATSYESGSGTADDPYIIVNGSQLALLASEVDNYEEYDGVYFKLGDDILLNDTTDWESWGSTDEEGYLVAPVNEWNAIGSNGAYFSGYFDGDGHVIKGLYINSTDDYNGLFAFLVEGTVANITLDAAYMKGGSCVGGIVGRAERGEIRNCTVNGTVVGVGEVGGVVGNVFGSSQTDPMIVSACAHNGIVSASSGSVGGVVAQASYAEICDCTNDGRLDGAYYVGGVVGTSWNSHLTRCSNLADIEAQSYIGGVVNEFIGGAMIDCHNSGNITGLSYIGGVAHRFSGTMTDCSNAGAVTATESYAAGIAKYADGTITRCRNTGAISAKDSASGLFDELSTATVSECVNSGDVSASYQLAAGLVRSCSGTISNCYNTGAVTSEDSAAVGLIMFANGTAVNCYNVGTITAASGLFGGIRFPGSDAVVEGCYYLAQDALEDTVGQALTSEQMQDADNFVNWDFLSVWEIGYQTSYLYPTLRSMGSKTYQYTVVYRDNDAVIRTAIVSNDQAVDLNPPENETYAFAFWRTADGTYYTVDSGMTATRNEELTAIWYAPTVSETAWDGTTDTAWSGSGTESDPYLIATPAQLAGIGESADNGDDFSNVYFKITDDFILNDSADEFCDTVIGRHPWKPISTFNGYLDGDGHTISGLYIHSSEDGIGLFSTCYGTLSNITLSGAYVVGNDYVGALAGYLTNGNTCVLTESTVSGNNYVGGLVGKLYDTMTDCRNDATVTVTGTGVCTGGLVGESDTDSTMSNVIYNGTVVGTNYAGGIVGNSGGTLENGTNNGTVTATYEAGGIAGMTGYFEPRVVSCINNGTVTAPTAGGIVGVSQYTSAVISQCVNNGVIQAAVAAGGLVAYHSSTIDQCVNRGSVESDDIAGGLVARSYSGSVVNSYNVGDISGKNYAGGIIGYDEGYSGKATIDSVYSVGSLQGTTVGGVLATSIAPDAPQIEESYYLNTTASDNGYGTALTEDDFNNATEAMAFDFLSVWEIGYEDSYAYPTLIALGSKVYRYSVTYRVDGKLYAERVYYEGSVIDLTAPIKSGYQFAYWRDADGNEYTPDATVAIDGYMTLTAVWTVRSETALVWDGSVDIEWRGSGTADDPYLISSPEELAGIHDQFDEFGGYSGIYFKQTVDLTLNSGGDEFGETVVGQHKWTPIGTDSGAFYGTYDGNGYTIRGLYIHFTGNDDAGLFGSVHGTVKNLTLTESYIHVTKSGSTAGVGGVGGIVGVVGDVNARVEGCISEATVISDAMYVGGVVGYMPDGTVNNCENRGTVTASNHAGGVVGYMWSDAVVTNGINSGTVKGAQYVGGVVGYARSSTVEGSLNLGVVSGKRHVGGIVGYFTGSLNNCSNHGLVESEYDVGGIVGLNMGTVSGCYNVGTVTATVDGAGGIVGYNNSNILDCYNSGDIGGANYIAGIAAYNYSTVSNVYSVGTVSGINYAAAIVSGQYGTVQNAYYADTLPADTNATALTDAQMRSADSFAGFDFETYWIAPSAEADYGYPTLTGALHTTYYTVVFVGEQNETIASDRYADGETIVYPDMSGYVREEDGYIYSFDRWDQTPAAATGDITITALFNKTAKIYLEAIENSMTVEYGYSKDNLLVDIESMYDRLLCTATTGYRVISDASWDMSGYDPYTAGNYVLTGHLALTDQPYYGMSDGATVTLTVTVLPADDQSKQFHEADLVYEELADGTLAITGYTGAAERIVIPSSINGKAVSVIAAKAFADNRAIAAVSLPQSVTTIEAGAFRGCSALVEVTLPEGLTTVGDAAFYDTALESVTCPQSLVSIGANAFGFYGDAAAVVNGFTVYAFENTASVTYATDHGLLCVTTAIATADSGVKAVVEETLTLAVTPVTEGAYFENAHNILEKTQRVTVLDISLYTTEGENTQPGNMMTVMIPVPAGYDARECRVYRINADGSYKDMLATLQDGYLIFTTAHLSYYAVVDEGDAVRLGDVNSDGNININDAIVIYRAVAGTGSLTEEQRALADYNGDGNTNINDAIAIYKVVAGV